MDAGSVAGKCKADFRYEPVPEGWEDGGKVENLLEPFTVMKGEISVSQGVSGHLIRDAGMLTGKLLPLLGFLEFFPFLSFGKRSGLLGDFGLCPLCLVFCFDTGHANFVGIDFEKFITTLGNRLKVLHLHDNDGIEACASSAKQIKLI